MKNLMSTPVSAFNFATRVCVCVCAFVYVCMCACACACVRARVCMECVYADEDILAHKASNPRHFPTLISSTGSYGERIFSVPVSGLFSTFGGIVNTGLTSLAHPGEPGIQGDLLVHLEDLRIQADLLLHFGDSGIQIDSLSTSPRRYEKISLDPRIPRIEVGLDPRLLSTFWEFVDSS